VRPLVRLGLAAVLSLTACTPESPQSGGGAEPSVPPPAATAPAPPPGVAQANRPPTIKSAHITPTPVRLAQAATVLVEAEDPDGDSVTLRYQWLADGTPIPEQTGPTFIPKLLKRGDRVSVEVTPLDGKEAGQPFQTEAVEIGNTPPVVTSVTLEPNPAKVGDQFRAVAEASDADKDEILYQYEWWRNGQPLAVQGATLPTEGFARDDSIVAGVTPRDKLDAGKIVFAEPIRIGNTAPVITSSPSAKVERGRYEYAVVATDVDKDDLLFKLETAPAGMAIDNKTGRIEWQVPPEVKGTQRIRVMVEDGHQGHAFQEFTLTPPPS